MIYRSRQAGGCGRIRARQETLRLQIAPQVHRKIRRDHCADMRRTDALAWRFFVARGGLRAFRGATHFTNLGHGISQEIAHEKQHGQKRENAQKPGPMQRRHQPNG